jgi:hypothetical protein
MRFYATAALSAAAFLAGTVNADAQSVLSEASSSASSAASDASSSTSSVASSASSAPELPTFTVSIKARKHPNSRMIQFRNWRTKSSFHSRQPSRPTLLSNSQTTGMLDGSPPMPRRIQRVLTRMRSGRMLENGL